MCLVSRVSFLRILLLGMILLGILLRTFYSLIVYNSIPLKESINPMTPIQVIPLSAGVALFKRSYNCQKSGFELFYQSNARVESIYFFFPDMVRMICNCLSD